MTKVLFGSLATFSLVCMARCMSHGHAPAALMFAASAALNALGLCFAVMVDGDD